MDAATLALHYGKHHQAYVDKLNAALLDYPQYRSLTVQELLRSLHTLDPAVRDDIRNQGGGHANHSLLWQTLSPHQNPPGTVLSRLIAHCYGSLDRLKQEFRTAAARSFGSGWVFLTSPPNTTDTLQVVFHPNQDSPLSFGATPILAVDLWEHAYYLKYRADRPGWLDAWWKIVDWQAVGENFDAAQSVRSP
jgi:Fe-Mn family superoxide dismutase